MSFISAIKAAARGFGMYIAINSLLTGLVAHNLKELAQATVGDPDFVRVIKGPIHVPTESKGGNTHYHLPRGEVRELVLKGEPGWIFEVTFQADGKAIVTSAEKMRANK